MAGRIIDRYPNPVLPARVELDYNTMFSLMGNNIGENTMETILRALEIKLVARNEKTVTVEVPPYRVDVKRECDVVEEVLRLSVSYTHLTLPTIYSV